jgi:SAM-dependent methyltransferase
VPADQPRQPADGQPALLGQAAELLSEHPWIDAAGVDPDGAIRIRAAASALAVRPELGGLIEEYLDHWGEVYDWAYSKAEMRHAHDLDLSGWRASDTGGPMPVDHMREWIEHTVELVLSARPRWILELGCGTGLLTHRLRDHVRGYVGADIAAAALEKLRGTAGAGADFVQAAAHESRAPRIRAALEAVGAPRARPDCVLLNSVTQCFPNVAYLRAVLHDAIDLVAAGGTVFVGDVRDVRLHADYCRWLERATDAGADPGTVSRRAAERAAHDDELLCDPLVLAEIAAEISAETDRSVRMSVHPKTMRADTELTRYRFDAVLYVDPAEPPADPEPISWAALPGDDRLAALSGSLSRAPLRVHGIPNRLLTDRPDAVTAFELRRAVADRAAVVADPADPASLGVVAPPAAAAAAVAEVVGGGSAARGAAHEPFTVFVPRRLTEVARTVLRRELSVRVAAPIRVDDLPDADRGAAVGAPAADAPADGGPAAGGPADGGPAPGAAEVLRARAERSAARAIGDVEVAELPTFMRRLDEIALRAMAATLAPGGLSEPGAGRTAAEVAEALGVAERHRWILRRWLDVLAAEGMLGRDGHGRFRELRPVRRLADAGRALDEVRRGLGYPAELTRFFQVATEYLPQLLRDEVSLQALLFAGDDPTAAEGAYRDNVVNRYLNAGVAQVLRWAAESRPGEPAALRVLELGAGVGGTTSEALLALAGRDIDYLFTDVSRYFLSLARERFADRPGVRFGIFDINADAGGPDVRGAVHVPDGTQHVVLSANVLHNARHIGRALRRQRDLLVPGGLFVFVETCRELYSIMTSMQFLMSARPGQNRLDADDPRAATDRVFLTRGEWLSQLEQAGLRPMFALPAEEHPLTAIGVQLFVAHRSS